LCESTGRRGPAADSASPSVRCDASYSRRVPDCCGPLNLRVEGSIPSRLTSFNFARVGPRFAAHARCALAVAAARRLPSGARLRPQALCPSLVFGVSESASLWLSLRLGCVETRRRIIQTIDRGAIRTRNQMSVGVYRVILPRSAHTSESLSSLAISKFW
jgi:hypothetical protein